MLNFSARDTPLHEFLSGASLDKQKYSSDYWEFLQDCLTIDYQKRPSAIDLLAYPIFRKVEKEYFKRSATEKESISSTSMFEIELLRDPEVKSKIDFY